MTTPAVDGAKEANHLEYPPRHFVASLRLCQSFKGSWSCTRVVSLDFLWSGSVCVVYACSGEDDHPSLSSPPAWLRVVSFAPAFLPSAAGPSADASREAAPEGLDAAGDGQRNQGRCAGGPVHQDQGTAKGKGEGQGGAGYDRVTKGAHEFATGTRAARWQEEVKLSNSRKLGGKVCTLPRLQQYIYSPCGAACANQGLAGRYVLGRAKRMRVTCHGVVGGCG